MRVVIVDDHELVRQGLEKLLEAAEGIDVVGSLASGEEALRFVHGEPADVLVVDAHMPGMAGLEASRRILKSNPHLAVVVMVDDSTEVVPTRLIKTGALGFITKTSPVQELLNAIESVVAGKRYIGSDLAKAMALSMFKEGEESPLSLLSDREMQILMKVSHGQSNHDIARELCLSPKTVSTYRYRLYEKLDVRNDVDLTHIALRHGIVRLKAP